MLRKYKSFGLFGSFFLFSSVCHASPMSVQATGAVKMAYDDNITYTSANRLSDFVTNLEAGLEIIQQSRTHQYSLKTDVIEEIFANHSNLDNTAEDMDLDLKQDLSKYDHLEFSDVLSHAYEPTSFDTAFGRTTGHYSTLTNQAGLSYSHDFSEHLSDEVHFRVVSDSFSQNGPQDSVTFQGGTKLKYTLDSATIFSQSYDYGRTFFSHGPGTTINSLVTGARRYFTPQFYVDLGVGPDFISSTKTNIEPHYIAALTDQFREATLLSLTYEKQDTTGTFVPGLFNAWRTALNLNQQITPRVGASMSVFYGQGRYESISVNEALAGVQTQVSYAATKRTKLSIGYTYSDSTSHNSGFAFRKNYVYGSVTIKF